MQKDLARCIEGSDIVVLALPITLVKGKLSLIAPRCLPTPCFKGQIGGLY